MLYLVRSGPETIALEFRSAGDFARAGAVLERWGIFAGSDPEECTRSAGAYLRVIITVQKKADQSEDIRVYFSGNSLARFFCMLLDAGAGDSVAANRAEPGYIVMRLPGDISGGMESVQRDYGGMFIDKKPFFRRTLPEDSTIIYFTQEPLNNAVPQELLHDRALLVTEHSKEMLLAAIRLRQTEYLSDSLGTPDWNSMQIQIGDKEERFALHRKRVWTAVQGLQLGVIAEEGWKREYTLMGKVVPVYVLTLITPFDAERIKGCLTGLEYDENGERTADLDLFFKGNKISWKKRFASGRPTKAEMGLSARQELLAKLDRYSLAAMRGLDRELKGICS